MGEVAPVRLDGAGRKPRGCESEKALDVRIRFRHGR
jgi:hypothetical protein